MFNFKGVGVRYRCFAIATAVILSFLTSCYEETTPPRKVPEPDADGMKYTEEVTSVRAGVDLITRRSQRSVQYWIRRDGELKIIVGEASDAELQSISPQKIQFLCRGYVDDGWQGFPYMITYNVEDDKTTTEKIFLSCGKPMRFGYYKDGPTPGGHTLSDVSVNGNSVTTDFGRVGFVNNVLITRPPETEVFWDEKNNILSFVFVGTRITPEVKKKTASLELGPLSDLVRNCILQEIGENTELKFHLKKPLLYRVSGTGDTKLMWSVEFSEP